MKERLVGGCGLACAIFINWRHRRRQQLASSQSALVSKLYEAWLAQAEDVNLIDFEYGWDVLTDEPGAVDYVEVDAGGIPALWATPKESAEDRVLVGLHGGGYEGGSMFTHRKLFAHAAKAAGIRALIVNYRLLRQGGGHPAAINDVLVAYRWLLEQGVAAGRVVFIGDSAGGGLAITVQLAAREQGVALPAAAVLISPWLDMAVTGETMVSNGGKDVLFTKAWVSELAVAYLRGADPRDPLASPQYADLAGLGPIYIQVGDQELLLDDSRRLAASARDAGVDVRLDVFEGQQHTFQMMAGRAPEADDAIARIAEWLRPLLFA